MWSVRTILIALLMLGAGCTSDVADKRMPGGCNAGQAMQCHETPDHTGGGQNNSGGVGGGVGGGMGHGMV